MQFSPSIAPFGEPDLRKPGDTVAAIKEREHQPRYFSLNSSARAGRLVRTAASHPLPASEFSHNRSCHPPAAGAKAQFHLPREPAGLWRRGARLLSLGRLSRGCILGIGEPYLAARSRQNGMSVGIISVLLSHAPTAATWTVGRSPQSGRRTSQPYPVVYRNGPLPAAREPGQDEP